ncbi:MAG TPA: thiamine-phosphate kinase, partial [Acidisarcina sp.]
MVESALIEEIRRRSLRISSTHVTLGIGDDCALIRPRAGEEIAITTDLSLENVHFRRDWHPAESVGHRCLARGLSDLAAMGARPIGALLSLALPITAITPDSHGISWVSRFLDGFLALAALHNVALVGGDTAQSLISPGGKTGVITADVVLLGAIKCGRALRRSGAKAGDLIYVTGALGGAAAEFLALQQNPDAFRAVTKAAPPGIHPHLYPAPRIAVGRKLVGLATSAIDLSDGLSTDLRHICDESRLAAEIYNLPLHPLAQAAEATGLSSLVLGRALTRGFDLALHL